METYKNLGGDSGILYFEIGNDYVRVEFDDEAIYTYTYASAGEYNIEEMKKIAISGEGLNSFINKYVRKKYASKE
ncbi:MAG: hypothetical protein KAQ87_02500 [Candidatus Pacebacteria bacterium]|nr:hypothetical protein [Candidatus Paceibacterota bacterium]